MNPGMRKIELAIEDEVKSRMATAEYKGKEKMKEVLKELNGAKALADNRKDTMVERGKKIDVLEKRVKGLEKENAAKAREIKKLEEAAKAAAA